MLILIAEAKTMRTDLGAVSMEEYAAHTPVYERQADEIIHSLSGLSLQELASDLKLTPSLARGMQKMIYDFPHKESGLRAIDAFTGVVFKALDVQTLSESACERMNINTRIISSLYGYLRPDDIIKPYRLDFTAKGAPDGRTMVQYWKRDVTLAIGRYLKEHNCTEILNLLPADAMKCIDWKLLKGLARVWKADFVEADGEDVRTPHAGKLKQLRGTLLREILERGITSVSDLKSLDTSKLYCEGTPRSADHLQFVTA